MLTLIPVLEFDPGLFRSLDHPYPHASAQDDPEGWQAYRRRCWADAGLSKLKAYRNSEFVRFEDADDPILLTLLQKHLELDDTISSSTGDGRAIDLDEISCLSGGFVLDHDDEHRVWPRCCGTLADLHNWAEACDITQSEAYDLWIGHPQLTVTSAGINELQICEQQEMGFPREPQEFTVAKSALRAAVVTVAAEVIAFEERVARLLHGQGQSQSEDLAAALTGSD